MRLKSDTEGRFPRHKMSVVYRDSVLPAKYRSDLPGDWTKNTVTINFEDNSDLLRDATAIVVRSITSVDGKPISLRTMRDAMQDDTERDNSVLSMWLYLEMCHDGYKVTLYALAQDLNETHKVGEVDPGEGFVFEKPFREEDIAEPGNYGDLLHAVTLDDFGRELYLIIEAGVQPLEYTYRLYRRGVPHALSWFVEALERVGTFFWVSFQEKADGSFGCTAYLGSWKDEVIIPRTWAKHFFVID